MLIKRHTTVKEFLELLPVISRVSVKWGDQDAFRHVNNTKYFQYQEVGRLKYFRQLLLHVNDSNFNKEDYMNATGMGPILSSTECRYKFPLTYPDKLLIGTTILDNHLQHNKFILTHYIWSLRHNRLVSEGTGTVVNYDYANSKTVDIPDVLVNAIHLLQQQNSSYLLKDSSVTNFDIDQCE